MPLADHFFKVPVGRCDDTDIDGRRHRAADTGGDLVDFSRTIRLSFAFMVISLLGFMISVPFWKFMGLIK